MRRFFREQKPPEGELGLSFPPRLPQVQPRRMGGLAFCPQGNRGTPPPQDKPAPACLPVGEKSAGGFKGRKRQGIDEGLQALHITSGNLDKTGVFDLAVSDVIFHC